MADIMDTKMDGKEGIDTIFLTVSLALQAGKEWKAVAVYTIHAFRHVVFVRRFLTRCDMFKCIVVLSIGILLAA